MTEQENIEIIKQAEKLSAELGKKLRLLKKTVATAESCTGGLIAKIFTEISGSSDYYHGGIVSYTNEVKHKFLGVKEETLSKYTAVSAQTASEMAEGARNGINTDFGLASTGIAGPSGATSQHPVGTVFMALAERGHATKVFHKIFAGNRADIRAQATLFILQKLKQKLEK